MHEENIERIIFAFTKSFELKYVPRGPLNFVVLDLIFADFKMIL